MQRFLGHLPTDIEPLTVLDKKTYSDSKREFIVQVQVADEMRDWNMEKLGDMILNIKSQNLDNEV